MIFTHVTKNEKVVCYSAYPKMSHWLMIWGVKLAFSDLITYS